MSPLSAEHGLTVLPGRATKSPEQRYHVDGLALPPSATRQRVCDQVGWSHRVLHEPDPTVTVNLDFLRPSRHLRCHPRPEVHEQILSVFATGREIGEGREMVNRRSPELALPYIKHLIWHRRLAVDLTARLDFGTVATSVADLEDVPCCA